MPRFVIVSDDLRQRTAAVEALRRHTDEVATVRTLEAMGRRFPEATPEAIILIGRHGARELPEPLVGARLIEVERAPELASDHLLEWNERLLSQLGFIEVPPEVEDAAEKPKEKPKVKASRERVGLLAIASSTGGPDALAEVFRGFKNPLGVPGVIVQHMPADFISLLAARLDRLSPMTVKEGYDGAPLTNDVFWIAPGNHHMVIAKDGADFVLRLNQEPPVHSCRPAADPMMYSVAHYFGANALGLVLTGMGNDGLDGCQHIVDAGGTVIAQDEESSVVWGMPGFVARAGLASSVIPLGEIGSTIEHRIRVSHLREKRRAG